MSLCIYCGRDFGKATSVICLHCSAPLNASKKRSEPVYRGTKTRLSFNARRILEFLGCFPTTVPAPDARTISTALAIDWGEAHRLLEQMHENGLITFTVSSKNGSQYFITPRGKTFL